MTKKAPKPTAQHMQKLADLMDTRPEGVNLRQVQNTLSVSPPLAKAALIEIGAVEVEGKWGFAEPEPEPVAERNASLNAVLMPSTQGIGHLSVYGADINWSKPPDGATHFQPEGASKGGNLARYFKDDFKSVCVPQVVGGGWRLVESLEIDLTGVIEIPRPSPVCTKSDFARVLEAERQRVFDAVAIGGTVERLAELTGLHVDDVQQHLDALIVDGVIYQKPIIVAMSYGVMG